MAAATLAFQANQTSSVDGSCTEGSFSNAIQRAIKKLPADVDFKIGRCQLLEGKLTVNLEFHPITHD